MKVKEHEYASEIMTHCRNMGIDAYMESGGKVQIGLPKRYPTGKVELEWFEVERLGQLDDLLVNTQF